MLTNCPDCGLQRVARAGTRCKPCGYRIRSRPSGLKYKVKVINQGWIKTGQRLSVSTEFKPGQVPPMKGKKGIRLSPSTEFKKGDPRLVGENNPRWNGGITPAINKLRNSPEVRAWRKAVFKRDGYTCQICLIRGGKLNADHIKQFAYYPELRLELSNGRTLCVACHESTETYRRRLPLKELQNV